MGDTSARRCLRVPTAATATGRIDHGALSVRCYNLAGHTTVGPPAVLHLVGVVAPWPRRLARHSGLGKCGGVRCFRGRCAPCSYCPAWWNGGPSAPAFPFRGRVTAMHWCGEMTRINRLRAPAPGETAHRYLLPLHCVRVAAGKRPARSNNAAVTSTGPQGPPQRGHARGRARGPVHADPDLPWVRLHLVDNAAEQLRPRARDAAEGAGRCRCKP